MRIILTSALAASFLASDAHSFAFTPINNLQGVGVKTSRGPATRSINTHLSQSSNGRNDNKNEPPNFAYPPTDSSSSLRRVNDSNDNANDNKSTEEGSSSYLFGSTSSNYKMSITQTKSDINVDYNGGRDAANLSALDASTGTVVSSTDFPTKSAGRGVGSNGAKLDLATARVQGEVEAEIKMASASVPVSSAAVKNKPNVPLRSARTRQKVQDAEIRVQKMVPGPGSSSNSKGSGFGPNSKTPSETKSSLMHFRSLERQVEAKVQKSVEAAAEREVVAAAEKMVEMAAQADVELALLAKERAEKERRAEALVESRVEAAAEVAVIAKTERMVEGSVESQMEENLTSAFTSPQLGGTNTQSQLQQSESQIEDNMLESISSKDTFRETSESEDRDALPATLISESDVNDETTQKWKQDKVIEARVEATVELAVTREAERRVEGYVETQMEERVVSISQKQQIDSQMKDNVVKPMTPKNDLKETSGLGSKDDVPSAIFSISEAEDEIAPEGEKEAVIWSMSSKEEQDVFVESTSPIEDQSTVIESPTPKDEQDTILGSEPVELVVEDEIDTKEDYLAERARKERLAEARVESQVEAAAELAVIHETERIVEGYIESQKRFRSTTNYLDSLSAPPSTSSEPETETETKNISEMEDGDPSTEVSEMEYADLSTWDKGLSAMDDGSAVDNESDVAPTMAELDDNIIASRSDVEGALSSNAKAIAEIRKALAEVEDDISLKKQKLASTRPEAYEEIVEEDNQSNEKVPSTSNSKDISVESDNASADESSKVDESIHDNDDAWNFTKFMEEKFGFSDKRVMQSVAAKKEVVESDLEIEENDKDASATITAAAIESGWKIEPTVDLSKSRTQRIMEKTKLESQTGGAGGVSTWDAFKKCEENWRKLRDSVAFEYNENVVNGIPPPYPFVTSDGATGNAEVWEKLRYQFEDASLIQRQCNTYLDYDVVVCGGTLGIFAALALQLKGRRVCVIEGGRLQGREQEWNISMDELMELVDLGVLTQKDLDEAIKTEFPVCRSGFKNKEAPTTGSYFENGIGYEVDIPGVLNLGVAPKILIENVKQRFLEKGGIVKELTPIKGVVVSEKLGAGIDLGKHVEPITTRIVLDCMGNASPISRQQRYGMKPDGVCCVVGSCAGGFDRESNVKGDIIYTNSEMQDKGKEGMLQYFWEAFPVNIGKNGNEPGTSDVKTTYMFTYLDADKDRPDMLTMMEDYWDLLPIYQPSIQDPEKDLDVERVLFAFFPTYRDSPLKPAHSRLLAIGDASGIQSPLSFGGFGALTRHLGRVSNAVDEALKFDLLSKSYLSEINAYTPNLSAAWMFQRAMSVRMGQNVDSKFVNRLLATNFQIMDEMGIDTIKPFLQDVIRVDGLAGSLARSFKADPFFMPAIVAHVGVPSLADWLRHVGMMGAYTFFHSVMSPLMKPFVDKMENNKEKFLWRRRMEAWKFGSGADYILPRDKK